MPFPIHIALLCGAVLLSAVDPALASQGPGAGPGTAGPLAQWLAVLCGIALPTIGVIASWWDEGHYGDFSSGV